MERIMRKRQKREEGFTLVEVMVTLVIIGLLTTFVVINVLPAQDKALVPKNQRRYPYSGTSTGNVPPRYV